MIRNLFVGALVGATTLGLGTVARSQAASQPTRHTRVVLVADAETQEPIVDATVTDLATKNSIKTSKDGAVGLFVPEFVKPTGALLRFTKLGYDVVGPMAVDPTVDTTLIVTMHRSVTSLPTVTTTEKYRIGLDAGTWDGFAARCSVSTVMCFKDDELSANPSDPLVHFLEKTPGAIGNCGATMTRGGAGRRSATARRAPDCIKMRGIGAQAAKLCVPTYFVDGFMRGYQERTLDEIEQAFGAREVKGIEVYQSGEPIPPRFDGAAGNVGCGVVAIWTK